MACKITRQAHYVDPLIPALPVTADRSQEPGTTTDVFADHSIMKRLDSSPKDDNIPIYISFFFSFFLLLAIFLLSFLATVDIEHTPDSNST